LNPAPIARIDRLTLSTARLARLRGFYAGQLGAQRLAVPAGGPRSVLLDFCGVCLELIERPGDRGPAHIALALGSADAVDRTCARLAAAGHPVLEPPHRSREGRYRGLVLDPDGNRVELTV
jgi:catechol 2,3-dioxygenase-like lactoylglutathione lyase family enzyme